MLEELVQRYSATATRRISAEHFDLSLNYSWQDVVVTAPIVDHQARIPPTANERIV
jgi:hypothetical protein